MEFFLLEKKQTYRLILPLIPGETYQKLFFSNSAFTLNQLQQITLFKETVKALADCHQKGYIVVDLSKSNILYDFASQRSYLIDGGLSSKKSKYIEPELFQMDSEEEVDENRSKPNLAHFAPECWSVFKVPAASSMDVYSLGILMRDILDEPYPEIKNLIQQCIRKNPEDRPTLDNIENILNELLKEKLQRSNPIQIQFKPHSPKANLCTKKSIDKKNLKVSSDEKYPDWKKRLKKQRCAKIIVQDGQYEISRFFSPQEAQKLAEVKDLKQENPMQPQTLLL